MALLLALALCLALGACGGAEEPEEEMETGEVEPELVNGPPLPVSYQDPPGYEKEGWWNSALFTYRGTDKTFTIQVDLHGEGEVADALALALEGEDSGPLEAHIGDYIRQPGINLGQFAGFPGVSASGGGRRGEQRMSFLLQVGDYVVEIRGSTAEDSVGQLQRNVEEILATLQVEDWSAGYPPEALKVYPEVEEEDPGAVIDNRGMLR